MRTKLWLLIPATLLTCTLLLALTNFTKAAPTFTGNAAADFTGPSVIKINDRTTPDVGLPGAFPQGTISGFDM